MKPRGATAAVFLSAFETLPKKERDIFLTEILKEKEVREDLIDIAIAESRAKAKGRPLWEFLEEHQG